MGPLRGETANTQCSYSSVAGANLIFPLANALPMPDEAPVTSAAVLLAVVGTIVCSSLCDVSNPEALYAAPLALRRIHLFVSIETYF
jgi:hypothetical protein